MSKYDPVADMAAIFDMDTPEGIKYLAEHGDDRIPLYTLEGDRQLDENGVPMTTCLNDQIAEAFRNNAKGQEGLK